MSLIALLQEFDGKEIAEDESGEPIIGKLKPGLSSREIQELAGLIPCKIPAKIQDLLQLTRGLDQTLELMDFSGLSLKDQFSKNDLFPYALPIAGDGIGNYWICDLEPNSKDWGPIFYFCNDPPVVVWQAKTLEEFIAQLISFASMEEGSPINLVHDEYSMHIFEQNPNTISEDLAIQPGDPDLGIFVQSLKKGYLYIDLRRGRTGDGFCWARWQNKTEIIRNGNQRLFAYRKRPNFIQKLLGQ